MDAPVNDAPDESGFGLREILGILSRGRWSVVLITVVCTAAGSLLAWRLPVTYTASALLSPVVNSNPASQPGGLLGSMASQVGGLSSLMGLSAGDSKKAESVAVLQSQSLTQRYIIDHNLLPILYWKKWDAARGRWKVEDPKKVPTPWTANQLFKKQIRTVVTDSKTGLVTITIVWTDPGMAAKWANDLVALANAYLRAQAINESEKSIEYLNEEAAKMNSVEARQALYQVLESELTKLVFAKGNTEYAFKVIDPAVPPESRSSLPPTAWVIFGLLAGLVLSLPILLIRERLPAWLR